MKKCLNPNCNKELKKFKKKYCSDKCQKKDMYQRKKEIYKANARKWEKKNPEKFKEQCLKANKKFRETKRDRFNQLMRNNYHNNKQKWNARVWTYQMINRYKTPIKIDKVCKKCKSSDNLSLKFEVYPNKADDIRQAIKEGTIYYLCKDCRKLKGGK